MTPLFTLRVAVRQLLRSPGYLAAGVVTIALAIAANSALFSTIYAVLLSPLPIRDPGQLVIAWQTAPDRDIPVVEVTYRTFEYWKTNSRSFAQAGAVGSSTWPMVFTGKGEPARLAVSGVTATFFETLGAAAMLGRTFTPSDDVPNAARTAVLSYGTWTRRFGGNPAVLGTSMLLNGNAHTIVGVMPQQFDFPRGADLWTPVVPVLTANSTRDFDVLRQVGVLYMIARLREGATAESSMQELARVNDQRFRDGLAPVTTGVVVTPFTSYTVGPLRQVLLVLFAAVGVLLLVACSNVSSLIMARVSLKSREHAVLRALGATRGGVAFSWMVEAALLAIAGGSLGLLASGWVARAIVAFAPVGVPRLDQVSINLPVMAFTLLAIAVTILVAGLGPARRAGAANMLEALNDSSRGNTMGRMSGRTRSAVSVFQIGVAVVLLIASGLVVRSFTNLRQIDLGFQPSGVLTMDVGPQLRTNDPMLPVARNEWLQELISRIEKIPGVQSAGAIYLRPLAHGPIGQELQVVLEGQADTVETRRGNPQISYQVATPSYFSTMRIALKRGRSFTAQDTTRSPRVAIVSESTARRLWPGQDPVGKRFLTTSFLAGSPTAWRTVVGVVSDVHYRGIDDLRLDVYDAALQSGGLAGDLVVRASGDPLALSTLVQAEARRLNPQVLIDRVTTMENVVEQTLAPWRLSAWMFTAFAVFVFVLATLGMFSVVSYDVANRRREFAVRAALGASSAVILRSVVAQAGARIAAGVILGVTAAALTGRALESMLFGVGSIDVSTYIGVAALVCVVVGVASYLPARRSLGLNPMTLLRAD